MNNLSIKLASVDDAMQIIYSGSESYLITLDELCSTFFELKNGLAGEIFQKFVNYRFRIAIIIPLNHGLDDRVVELIRDHTNHPYIRFYEIEGDAKLWLESA